MQNVMIEQIKEKLRDKQLDISPTSPSLCSYGKMLLDQVSSGSCKASPTSSRKNVVKDELSNGSGHTPTNCREGVSLSLLSNEQCPSQLNTVDRFQTPERRIHTNLS